jgi:hypothetical protein
MTLTSEQRLAVASIYYNATFLTNIALSVAHGRNAFNKGLDYIFQQSLSPVCNCWGAIRLNIHDINRVIICGPSNVIEGVWYAYHNHRNVFLRIIKGFDNAREAFRRRQDYALPVTLPSDIYSLTTGNTFTITRSDFMSIQNELFSTIIPPDSNTYDLPEPALLSLCIETVPSEIIGNSFYITADYC